MPRIPTSEIAPLNYTPDGRPPLTPLMLAHFWERMADPEPFNDEERAEAWGIYVAYLRRMPYAEYLETPWWKALREAAHQWWGSSCRTCGATKRLHVHHRSYANLGNELPDDLTILCGRCHALIHGKADGA